MIWHQAYTDKRWHRRKPGSKVTFCGLWPVGGARVNPPHGDRCPICETAT